MKKIVSIILAVLIMSTMLAGCSKSNNPPANNIVDPDLNQDDVQADDSIDIKDDIAVDAEKPANNNNRAESFANSSDEFLEKIGKLIDMDMYEVDEAAGYVELTLKDEYQKSFDFNYRVDIGNDSIKLPVSFADMKNSAFSSDVANDKKISNHLEYGVTYQTTNGKEITLSTTNTNDLLSEDSVECDIADCTFYKFSAYVFEEDSDDNVEKNNEIADFDIYGITSDSSIEDVLEAVKNPTYITYDADFNTIEIMYSEKIGNSNSTADYSRLSVDFFAVQNRMESIKYEYAPAAVK